MGRDRALVRLIWYCEGIGLNCRIVSRDCEARRGGGLTNDKFVKEVTKEHGNTKVVVFLVCDGLQLKGCPIEVRWLWSVLKLLRSHRVVVESNCIIFARAMLKQTDSQIGLVHAIPSDAQVVVIHT